MSAIWLPKPGSEFGPCIECRHKDCAEMRAKAESPCRVCNKPFGYDVMVYSTGHAECLELEAEHADAMARG